MLVAMDLGQPISYRVLSKGTSVYSADGDVIGKVSHVLARGSCVPGI